MTVPALPRRAVLAGALALATAPSQAAAPPRRPAHAPRPSDICFSARWARPEALEAAKAFGATRLDWCYTRDRGFMTQARQAGLAPLGGALNTILTDSLTGRAWREGRILDREGRPVTAPWMRWPGMAWGCVNSPAYRTTWLAHAKAGLEAGIDWFIVDDPRMNEAAVAWGGCFCQDCQASARREGADLATDMRGFQRRSVTRFHQDMRAEVDAIASRRVTFASNNVRGQSGWPYDLFDFGIAEADPRDVAPAALARMLRAAEMAGRPQVLTLRSEDVALNRRVIAWSYANGGHLLAPWDVYLRSTPEGSDRFFGHAEDFAPIYAMARALAPLLDAAVVSGDPPNESWRLDRPGWEAALRTTPDGRRAALHLVPWQAETPARLTLDLAALMPGPAGAELHGPGGMSRRLGLAGGPLTLDVPAAPWLVVALERAG
ncbi:hypothetical protein ACVFYP_19870 [Roseomonas sp. F4]